MQPIVIFGNSQPMKSHKKNYDYLDINYSPDGVTWDWLDYRTGSTNGNFISDSTTEITAAADMFDSFYFGFGLESDLSINYDGVYLDDVVLTRQPITISSHGYGSYAGTSMAAPHVSGLAGLIKAFNPALTNLEIKNIILNNVDLKSSLTGKVLTGGRINAFKALSAACPYLPVRIVRITPVYFSTLQAAYDAAGDGETIQSEAVTLIENPNLNLNKSVILDGGYNCDYSSQTGVTTLKGTMTVSNGIAAIGSFSIEP